MPRHDIWITLPDKPLKNVDTTIAIWSNSEKLGELRISRGTLDWKSAHKRSAKSISWERFAEMLDSA